MQTIGLIAATTAVLILALVAEAFRQRARKAEHDLEMLRGVAGDKARRLLDALKDAADLRREIAEAKARRCKPRGAYPRETCERCGQPNVVHNHDGSVNYRAHPPSRCAAYREAHPRPVTPIPAEAWAADNGRAFL